MKKVQQVLLVFLLLVFVSCSKKTSAPGIGGGTPPPVPVPITTLINLPSGWKYSSSYSTGFPASIQAYKFDSIYAGRTTKAFCVAYDSRSTTIEFKPVLSATAKKPSEFFSQESGLVYACINGGYFGSNQSYSLVKYNNVVAAANIKLVNRVYNGSSTPYYPTRVAFGINSTGTPLTAWIYHVGVGNDNIYSYPNPSPNVEGNLPQNIPTDLFPAGGSIWNAVSAIGGSPMLLKAGSITISDVAELINVNNTTSRPRSAIGYTSSGMIIILAVEGDNSVGGYSGMNLLELSNMIKDLGCTEAINLDGGGSTSMIIGGQTTVRPGDNGVERPIVSAVLLKKY